MDSVILSFQALYPGRKHDLLLNVAYSSFAVVENTSLSHSFNRILVCISNKQSFMKPSVSETDNAF